MKSLSLGSGLFLSVDIALLAISLLHVPSLQTRQRVPFDAAVVNGRVLIKEIVDTSACAGLQWGDEVQTWNGQPLLDISSLEFLADLSRVEEPVLMTVARNSLVETTQIRLISYYSVAYVVMILIMGIATWCVGVFVLIVRQKDHAARVLHWAMILLGASIMLAWGALQRDNPWTYVARIVNLVVYIGVATTFFHVTTIYPKPKLGSSILLPLIVYTPGIALFATAAYFQISSLHNASLAEYANFMAVYDIQRVAIVAYVLGGIANFAHSYARAESLDASKKLKWILFGLSVGPTPFLVLTIVPELFLSGPVVPEDYTLLFLLIIPIAFAVSLVKYHILDVELVISRATVYAMVLGTLVLLYTVLVGAVVQLVGSYFVEASVTTAVVLALLFEPARRRVQKLVDRYFFRVRYDFRHAERRFVEGIKQSFEITQLAELIVRETDQLIPVEKIGFFRVQQPENRLQVLAHRNFDTFERHGLRFSVEKLKTALQLPVALKGRIEPGIHFEPADESVFHRWGMVLVIPMFSRNSEFNGFLVLGEKKSGAKYTIEDIDLLNNVSAQVGLALERLTLAQKLVLTRAEAQHLEELSQLKSDFVSYVSHELRTPLTSIKMFAELLEGHIRRLDRKPREYVTIIQGEADRLNRMVSTILDSAKVERGVKEYFFENADLREITQQVMKTMGYQLSKQGFRAEFRVGKRRLPVYADPDAVGEAIMNLLTNSIKYSTENKHVRVSLAHANGWATCTVRDRGRGISPDSIPHIFERFYRDPNASRHVEGVGLGLPLVKHIMDAHGGSIELNSEPGKGSTFTLLFPLRKTNDAI